jgi:transcriptional regulator with XRE-family HTH domain
LLCNLLNIAMQIASKIRKIRELKGYSQEYMADKLKVSQATYIKLEKDDKFVNFEKLAEISAIFEIDPLKLINFDEQVVFNNYNSTQAGFNNYIQLPEKLIEQYEARIKQLEEEVVFLRAMANK